MSHMFMRERERKRERDILGAFIFRGTAFLMTERERERCITTYLI